MSFGLIYLITNKINSKLYVGQTTISLPQRWASHKCAGLNKPRHLISKAIGKYGPDNFTIEEICTAESREELDDLERRCIVLMDSMNRKTGYNMTPGGDGYMEFTAERREKMSRSQTGRKHSPESRQKISDGNKGKTISDEQKAAISKAQTGSVRSEEFCQLRSQIMTENNPFKGKTHTDETRQRMREAKKGYTPRPRTPEELEKIRIANTGKIHSEESKNKMRSNWTPERRDAAAKQRAAWWAAKRAAKAA